MPAMSPEERDRLTRVEIKQDVLIQHLREQRDEIQALLAKHSEQIEVHDDFINGLKTKLAIVGAGFTLLGSVIMIGMQYLLQHLFGKGS